MKKGHTLVLFLLFLSGFTTATAYHKFLDNTSWKSGYRIHYYSPVYEYWWHTVKDTIIGGKSYTVLEHDITPNSKNTAFLRSFPKRQYVREDTINKQVWYLDSSKTSEVLWYDFNMPIGGSVYYRANLSLAPYYLTLEKIDTILTIWGNRRVLHFDTNLIGIGQMQWMEGVGLINVDYDGPFAVFDQSSFVSAYYYHFLGCVYKNRVQFYINDPPGFSSVTCSSMCPSIGTYDSLNVQQKRICENGDSIWLGAPCDTSFYWSTLALPGDTISTSDTLWVHPENTTTYLWHGSIKTDTVTIVVDTVPTLNLGPDTAICANEAPLLLTAKVNEPISRFTWSNNSSSSSILVNKTGSYSLSATNKRGCSTIDTINLRVHNLPSVRMADDSISLNSPPVALNNAQPVGGKYFGTGIVNGVFDPKLAGLGSHVLHYTYRDHNGCSDTATAKMQVYQVTSTETHAGGQQLSIYPNPNNGNFNIEMTNIDEANITIHDMNGRIIAKRTISNPKTNVNLDIANGIYVLRLHVNESIQNYRLIIQ